MRHRIQKLKTFHTGMQKRENVMRNLLTCLITHGQLTTTSKRVKVLKNMTDRFFNRLLSMFNKYEDEKAVRREAIRYIKSVLYTELAGKKVINEILPKYKEDNKLFGFTSDYKLGPRPHDSAEKVLIKLL